MEKQGSNLRVALCDAAIGGFVTCGSYPQGADGEKRPIEWLVLKKEKNRYLLISRYGLDVKPYHTHRAIVIWEDCSLRKWLNDEFYWTAFAGERRSMISESTVLDFEQGKARSCTCDRVFLLSDDEMRRCFRSRRRMLRCRPTDYVRSNSAVSREKACWWLRNGRGDQGSAKVVLEDGKIDEYGYNVCYDCACVRPALWIDLNA